MIETRHGQPDRGTVPLSSSLEEGPRLAWPGAAGRRGPFRLVWSAAVIGNSGEIKRLSSRRFLIAQDGVLYRLADATFTRMLRNARKPCHPAILAGQRVRMASLIVELVGGVPTRVVQEARSPHCPSTTTVAWTRACSRVSSGLSPNWRSSPRLFDTKN